MPSLKDLKNRIVSVKSTRKITSAMKMVAASKLRRAQEGVESARPYACHMDQMLDLLLENMEINDTTSRLLTGSGKEDCVLLIVITSARGLCGAFNSSVVREARRQIHAPEESGKKVKLICVGRKARDLLRREHGDKIVHVIEDIAKKSLSFTVAQELGNKLVELFEAGEIDVARMVYNRFKSAISQVVTIRQILPVERATKSVKGEVVQNPLSAVASPALFELFEPGKDALIAQILPLNLSVQIYGTLLESVASEHGARMTSMDNATRNAGEMIDKLTLNYNRSRQAHITKELIEIISGAEAAV